MNWKDYSHERERLQSFRHWPSTSSLNPSDLAQEGFYYMGIRDQVCCFACKAIFELWRKGEDPRKKHKEASPECPLVRSKWKSKTEDPDNTFSSDDMTIEANRLATFKGKWPLNGPLKPEELAKAGFYFSGKEDKVECYTCHVILKNWKSGDSAQGEHRRYSPFCPLLNNEKPDPKEEQPQRSVTTHPSPPKLPPPSKQPYLEQEPLRLRTFRQWPYNMPVLAPDLAEAGFYYTGRRDAVRCFSCQVLVEQWMPGDVPVEEHVKKSPNCQFARSILKRKEGAAPATRNSETVMSYQERLATFRNWPSSSPVSTESLAKAGFRYAGNSDSVRCVTCGGALRGWERGDDAWGEHLRHFPTCTLVIKHFGRDKVSISYDEPWHQPSGKQSSSEPSDYTKKAIEMGFDEVLVEKIYHKGHENFAAFLEALMKASETSKPPSPPPRSPIPSAPPPPPQSMDIDDEIKHLCKICMEKEAEMLFLPCAHIVCCRKCAQNLHECPICRSPIESKIRSYFA